MYAVMAAREAQLQSNINEIQYRLTTLEQERQDLTQYSNNIADGQISASEQSNSSSSIFTAQANFAQNAAAYASSVASSSSDSSSYDKAYQQALEDYVKSETTRVAQIEAQLDQEKLNLENQLAQMNAELSSCSSTKDEKIQASAPKYG